MVLIILILQQVKEDWYSMINMAIYFQKFYFVKEVKAN
jgi:hypothetical protein